VTTTGGPKNGRNVRAHRLSGRSLVTGFVCSVSDLCLSLRRARSSIATTASPAARSNDPPSIELQNHLLACLDCHFFMYAISSFCALMMLLASRFMSGSLPYFSSTFAISMAPS